MKKTFLTTTLLLASICTFAQDKKFEFGLEAGPSMELIPSMLKNNNTNLASSTYQPQVGFNITPTFQYNFHRIFSFRVGLGYQNVRYAIQDSPYYNEVITGIEAIGTMNSKHSLHSFTLPAMIRASFGNKTKFFANVGTNLTVSTAANGRYDFTPSPNHTDFEAWSQEKVYGAYNISLGLLTGLGVSVPVTDRLNFSVEARNEVTLLRAEDLPYRFGRYKNSVRVIPSLLVGFSYKF